MKKDIKKYRKRFGILFLSVYTVFVLVGVFHYHQYNLDRKATFSNAVSTNRVTDLSSDFFSICSLHQFAHSINNFHYSSSRIVQSLSLLESRIRLVETKDIKTLNYSYLSLRAPPINS